MDVGPGGRRRERVDDVLRRPDLRVPAAEIDERWLDGVDVVGVTSGASAPERLVDRVCNWFRERGVSDIRPYSSVFEDVVFRLPVELRRAETPAA